MTIATVPMGGPHLQDVLSADRRNALRLLMFVRLAVSVAVAGFLIINFPTPSGFYWSGLSLLFGLFGVFQYMLGRSRHAANWHAYLFVVLDLALVTFIILHTNPFSADPFPPAQRLRYPNFDYLFVVVALLALGASPRAVAWSGVAAVLVWGSAAALIISLPGVMTENDVPGFYALPMAERLELANGPNFVWVLAITQELFVMLLFAFALAAIAWRARRLLARQMLAERARANLSRYFSPGMIEQLADQDEPLGAVSKQNVAVLFADIVGFTAIAEKQLPEEIIGLLREFHGRMARAVFAHGATVDKYIGDAIMVTFGTPHVGPRDATNALACANAMLRAVSEWNMERAAAGATPIEVGIGLHYGSAVLGDIGEERCLEYAVVGDTVNVASRLEALTRKLNTPLVISNDVVEAVRRETNNPDQALSGLARGPAANVSGRAGSVGVWTLSEAPPRG